MFSIKSEEHYLKLKPHYYKILAGMRLIICMTETSYGRICTEFNVNKHKDWRHQKGDNKGLGRYYIAYTGGTVHPFAWGVEYD